MKDLKYDFNLVHVAKFVNSPSFQPYTEEKNLRTSFRRIIYLSNIIIVVVIIIFIMNMILITVIVTIC